MPTLPIFTLPNLPATGTTYEDGATYIYVNGGLIVAKTVTLDNDELVAIDLAADGRIVGVEIISRDFAPTPTVDVRVGGPTDHIADSLIVRVLNGDWSEDTLATALTISRAALGADEGSADLPERTIESRRAALEAECKQPVTIYTTEADPRIKELEAENAALRDAIQDALPWMIKLGDYIGNGTQADPMGRCNAITKMRIAVEKRDD